MGASIHRRIVLGAVLAAAFSFSSLGCGGNASDPSVPGHKTALGYFMLVDGTLAVVDLDTYLPVNRLKVSHHAVHQVAALRDNRTVYTGDPDTGTLLKLTFSDDGTSVTRKEIGTSPVLMHAFFASPDDRVIAVTSRYELKSTLGFTFANTTDDSIVLIDTATDTVSAPIVLQSPATAEFSPDGQRLFVTNTHHQTLSVVDVATRQEIARLPVGEGDGKDVGLIGPDGMSVTLDGRYVATANLDLHTVTVFDTDTYAKRVISRDTLPHDVRFTPDSKELWIVDYARHPLPADEVGNASIATAISAYDLGTLTSTRSITPNVTAQRITVFQDRAIFTTAVGGIVAYDRMSGALDGELVVGGLGTPVVCGMVAY